jgi:hypothetical protein
VRPRERASLVALLVGIVLLGYPLINLPNQPVLVLGVPILYLYIFAVWLAGIGVAWLLSRESD